MHEIYDVAIVGGGLTGGALALALAQLPLKIVLIDANERLSKINHNYYDARSLALSPASKNIFSALNSWDAIKIFTTPIRQIHISDRGHFGFTRIDAQIEKVSALGYVIEFDHISQIIQKELSKHNNIVFIPAKITGLSIQNQRSTIKFDRFTNMNNGEQLAAKLIIAADGAQSTIRQLLNIPVKRIDYHQIAIVGNIGLQQNHQQIAFERFTEQGPLALLPLGEKRYAFVWSLLSKNAERILQLNDEDFIVQLQKQFGYRLGKFIWVGRRQKFPLQLIKTQENIHPHVVFIGNASHTLHPIAGQGFNLGLRDTAVFAQLLAQYIAENKSLVDPQLLHDYARLRIADHQSMIYLTDTLVKIFSNSYQPLILLRNLGLSVFDRSGWLKSNFSRKTMGFNGFIAKLTMGLPL